MKMKKQIATGLATLLVLASSMTAFAADDGHEAEGEGTAFPHVKKEIIDAKLPTTSDVGDIFNYYIDPERLIDEAGTLTDATTTVSANDAGVYFKQEDGSYLNKSQEVTIQGLNSVAIDVSVTAEVTVATKDIALVDETGLTAANTAKTPALHLTVNVGDDEKDIVPAKKDDTTIKVTASATIEGKPDNFAVTADGTKFKYEIKPSVSSGDADAWDSQAFSLTGETSKADVGDGMTAPKVKLTWSVAQHVDAYVSTTSVNAGADAEITLVLPASVTVSGLVITKADGTNVDAKTGTHYTISGTKLTLKSVSTAWKSVTVKYSDGHQDVITVK